MDAVTLGEVVYRRYSGAPGFEPVRRQFERNFTVRGELGGAVAAYLDGRVVVDLWGGYYDAPVSGYWPEFAAAGKDRITVAQLLAHQAGLCAVDTPLTPALIADREALAAVLARQRPAWRPGHRHGYHALTLGWYESELLRRVDPRGRGLSAFFADEVAGRLGQDFYIGLPSDLAPNRVAQTVGWPAWRMLLHLNTMPAGMVLSYLRPDSLTARTMGNPRLSSPVDFASPEYRSLEIPAATGFGTPGAGGSFGYADPANGLGYGYVTNWMGFNVWDDPRDLALRSALIGCVRGRAESADDHHSE